MNTRPPVSAARPSAGLVRQWLGDLESANARARYAAAKALRQLAERQPERLYPHFDFFAGLLDHENKIFQWQGIVILSHLARVDAARKFDAIFDRYFAPIRGPVMITAANVIGGAARLALARPEWADRIAAEVLKVRRAHYQTAECRNVAIGHALGALDRMAHLLENPEPVIRFVRRQLRNRRPAVRRKAAQFLRRYA